MQLFTDLSAVQRMSTGRRHWDISTDKKNADTSQNPKKFTKVLHGIIGFHHCTDKGLNDILTLFACLNLNPDRASNS
jgi:hypothetical protein